MSEYVDGVLPRHAMRAPSAKSKHAEHSADPAARFADQMATFDRMRAVNIEFRAAARPAPVNATRESRRAVAPPRSDAARAFAPGGEIVEASYPRGEIDLRRLTRK